MNECKPLIIGCSVPFGLFVPNLVFGSAAGQVFGRVVSRATWVSGRVAHPTTYAVLGEAVQVDPIKPTLKAPGIKLLNLNYDRPLSNFAFKFNLRRYSWVRARRWAGGHAWPSPSAPSW